jgi:hypothetical protein
MRTKIDIVTANTAEFKNELQQAIDAIEININNTIKDIKVNNSGDSMTGLIVYIEKEKKSILNESDDVLGVIGIDE